MLSIKYDFQHKVPLSLYDTIMLTFEDDLCSICWDSFTTRDSASFNDNDIIDVITQNISHNY